MAKSKASNLQQSNQTQNDLPVQEKTDESKASNLQQEEEGLVGAAISVSASLSFDSAKAESNTVQFLVQYPKEWNGPAYMPNGSVQNVHPEAAEQFEKMGIGKIVK
jgi:hypothetical protein